MVHSLCHPSATAARALASGVWGVAEEDEDGARTDRGELLVSALAEGFRLEERQVIGWLFDTTIPDHAVCN